ncbi:MAG: translation initiation factor [Planctomycetes bacterium]|nr:translation initiation factor [Planctomycetota bacterium]
MSSEDRPRAPSKPLKSLSALRDALAGEALPSRPEREIVPAKPAAPKAITAQLVVRFERAGRGGKTVTIAEGPALAGRKLDELARAAARALGVGARVEASSIVVQGDQCERLAAWFAKQGYASITLGTR